MKNTQLLKMFGEIDNKFLDEALGGDSEKPLKIDTSRAPVKWYRIAAPIAACLVLGAGIITLSRFINMPSPVDPPAISDTSSVPDIPITSDTEDYISATEEDLEACKQLVLKDHPEIEGFLTRIMDINFDGVDEAVLENGGIYIFSKSSSTGMIQTGSIDIDPIHFVIYGLEESFKAYYPSDHNESGAPYWYFCCAGGNSNLDISARAIARITYDDTGYGIDYPAAVYARMRYENSKYIMDDVRFKKNWSPKHDLNGEGGDTGVEIDQSEFLSIWEKHFSLNELGSDFADYLAGEDDVFQHDVQTFFPYLDLDAIPLMDSASFDPAISPVIRRARIAETSVCPHASVSAALVGENIFRLAEDGKEYMRMEKLSVIYYYETKLYAQVYLDPVDAGGGRGNFVIRAKDQLPIKSYHIALSGEERYDTPHIIVVGGEDFMRTDKPCCTFVRLNTLGGYVFDDTEPELTVLKGIYDSVNTTVSHVNTSNELFESGNSLIDYENKIEFCFFPEMFGYANPDAAHAHFKSRTLSPSEIPDVKGGYVYGVAVEHPEREAHESVRGTQDDLDRWYSFIASVKPAVIHAGGAEDYTFKLSDRNAAELFSIVKAAKPTLYSAEEDKPFVAGWPKWVVGCDSDGNALFEVQYNSVGIFVSFDDSGKLYYFNPKYSGIEKIGDYMYDPDHVYP